MSMIGPMIVLREVLGGQKTARPNGSIKTAMMRMPPAERAAQTKKMMLILVSL